MLGSYSLCRNCFCGNGGQVNTVASGWNLRDGIPDGDRRGNMRDARTKIANRLVLRNKTRPSRINPLGAQTTERVVALTLGEPGKRPIGTAP